MITKLGSGFNDESCHSSIFGVKSKTER
jgi:hypothetical protein